MRFARWTYLLAGIYGLVVLIPQYFLEEKTGRDYPPQITHPEFYYGFIGIAIAWQIAFVVISQDPLRFKPVMVAAILEKFTYGIAVATLYLQDRVGAVILSTAIIDSFLGILFFIAYLRLRSQQR